MKIAYFNYHHDIKGILDLPRKDQDFLIVHPYYPSAWAHPTPYHCRLVHRCHGRRLPSVDSPERFARLN